MDAYLLQSVAIPPPRLRGSHLCLVENRAVNQARSHTEDCHSHWRLLCIEPSSTVRTGRDRRRPLSL